MHTGSIRELRNTAFQRIGDHYRHFLDPNHFLGRSPFEELWMTKPKTNLSETQLTIHLEVALPGFSKEEITVEIEDKHLLVSAEKKEKNEKNYLQKEINLYKQSRVYELPKSIDESSVETIFENGILKINIDKRSTEKKSIKVE